MDVNRKLLLGMEMYQTVNVLANMPYGFNIYFSMYKIVYC